MQLSRQLSGRRSTGRYKRKRCRHCHRSEADVILSDNSQTRSDDVLHIQRILRIYFKRRDRDADADARYHPNPGGMLSKSRGRSNLAKKYW